MKMLSDIVSRAYCRGMKAKGPDRFFSVGCQMVGSTWYPRDPADAAQVAAQARAMEKSTHHPWEPDTEIEAVFNDLFSPFMEVHDDKLFVWIPVPTEESLSSTLMVRDWRILALVWWATMRHDYEGPIIAVAFDASGRQVLCDFKSEDVEAAFELAIAFPSMDYNTAGPACSVCVKAPSCPELANFLLDHGHTTKPDANPAIWAFRLFNERVELLMRIEFLEKRKAELDAELGKMVKQGKLTLGDGDDLIVPVRKTTSWDFGDVKRILMGEDLWNDAFGRIRSTELQTAMENFPKPVVDSLLKVKSERLSQPSISEAARHGRFSTGPTFIGGIALNPKKNMGRSK